MAIQRFIYIKQSEYEKMSPSYTQIVNWLEMANYNLPKILHEIKNGRELIYLWQQDSTEREYYWYGGQKEFVEQFKAEIIEINESKRTYRNLMRTNLKIDKTVDFQAENGCRMSGDYYDLKDEFPLQKNDAEVTLIQQIENWLSDNNRECDGKKLRLLIKISKGPCNHCRSVIETFQEKHPQIEIVVAYRQKKASERESAGRDQKQQSLLSFGYNDAKPYQNIFYRRLTELNSPNIVGYNMNNINRLYNDNKMKFNCLYDIDKYVRELPKQAWGENKEPIAIYLKHKFIYERELDLDDMERHMFNEFPIPDADRGKVVASAKLLLLSPSPSRRICNPSAMSIRICNPKS